MPNYTRLYELWKRVNVALVYRGNTYEPAWMDADGNLRHDAHVNTTRMMLERVLRAYSDIDADANSGRI